MSRDDQATRTDIVITPSTPLGFAASRRNLLAGIAVAALGLTSTVALAQGNGNGNGNGNGDGNPNDTGLLPGCGPSGNQPDKCLCFLKGTNIATPRGEIAIETLEIGDLVTTASGRETPIVWIGRMRFERRPNQLWDVISAPIKIARGALDGHAPTRDLYVSSEHCLFINGLLVTVSQLVNGVSIVRQSAFAGDALDYYHVELDSHDVVLANGAPAESLLGGPNRMAFDNFNDYVERYGSHLSMHAPFAPIISYAGGRQLLRSHVRSALAPIYDRRQPIDIMRDEIANRAERKYAA